MQADEARFTLFQCNGHVRVRREPHEALNSLCIVSTEQASGGSVMIWGCFCWAGLDSATLCRSNLKLGGTCMSCWPDNAKIHWAHLVTAWFSDHDIAFLHMTATIEPWLELCWAYMGCTGEANKATYGSPFLTAGYMDDNRHRHHASSCGFHAQSN